MVLSETEYQNCYLHVHKNQQKTGMKMLHEKIQVMNEIVDWKMAHRIIKKVNKSRYLGDGCSKTHRMGRQLGIGLGRWNWPTSSHITYWPKYLTSMRAECLIHNKKTYTETMRRIERKSLRKIVGSKKVGDT